ncbi:thiamine pyrophosphate-binding protein [Amycolatopsis pigmentata]|uniref:Thiamine pyrophosphate-binding protein n=1 Tax=Amycolatopsis pigmentata TaxID=450801 RepID=A0ABW5FNB8_9PSEU
MNRIGGDLVIETLRALGAHTVFGLPGQHALGLFDALRRSDLRVMSARVENNLAFAADGHARVTGEVTPMIVSTGPGALLTLASLHEARESSVPVLGISSQIPVAGLGGGRRGYLHELPDQQASFRDVVKSVHLVRTVSQIPGAIRDAWASASSVSCGPVWVEIPQDVLLAPASLPPVTSVPHTVRALAPLPDLIRAASDLLATAENPVILAGGGVVRAGAQKELLALAEALRAPVLSTFGGKGAFPWEHPLSGGSWLEDWHATEFLAAADVLLVLGSGLGELSSNYHRFAPRGRVIQIEADAGKLESNHAALGIHADVKLALAALSVPRREPDGRAEAAVAGLLRRVRERLAAQDLRREQQLLADLHAVVPESVPTFWDMTILGYWAWSAWPGRLHSAQGAGGLGFAFPAALGAAVHGPALAVSGDGGAMYGIAELATAVQHQLDVTWLIIDDGGYGILREYMTDTFGGTTATELARPDFAMLAQSFGVPAVTSTVDTIREDLAKALSTPGPTVVVLPVTLRMFAPTHLEH